MTFSVFAAISEVFVTLGVLYVIQHNYRGLGFKWSLALGVVLFEFFVNMLYMISRLGHPVVTESTKAFKILAAAHGSLSLLVFILLVTFVLLARQAYQHKRFFFQEHRAITAVFVVLWLLSVGSGEVIFFLSSHQPS